jgi:hypothetical protein
MAPTPFVTLRVSRDRWHDLAVSAFREDTEDGWERFMAYAIGPITAQSEPLLEDVQLWLEDNEVHLKAEALKLDERMVEKHLTGTLQLRDVSVGTKVILSGVEHELLYVNSCRALVRGKTKKHTFKPKKKQKPKPEAENEESPDVVTFESNEEYNVSPNSPCTLSLDDDDDQGMQDATALSA